MSSKIRSAQREIAKLDEIKNQIVQKNKNGYINHQEKYELYKKKDGQVEKAEKARKDLLKISDSSNENEVKNRLVKELIKNQDILSKITTDSKILESETEEHNLIPNKRDKTKIIFIDDNTLTQQSKEERKLIKRVFDIVDNCLPDKNIVENIRIKIIEEFNKGKQNNG